MAVIDFTQAGGRISGMMTFCAYILKLKCTERIS